MDFSDFEGQLYLILGAKCIWHNANKFLMLGKYVCHRTVGLTISTVSWMEGTRCFDQ